MCDLPGAPRQPEQVPVIDRSWTNCRTRPRLAGPGAPASPPYSPAKPAAPTLLEDLAAHHQFLGLVDFNRAIVDEPPLALKEAP